MSILHRHLDHPNSAISQSIDYLKSAIENSCVYRPKKTPKFVFLCGANKNKHEVSERRKALMDFSAKHLPHNKFFLAEKVFSCLKAEGHTGNLIDIEHDISKFSDHILIVLESPSSFAELGAFSHKELRSKLIVVNDVEFEKEQSFVNLGPIQAVIEAKGKERIFHYKMKKDGVHNLDGIGDIYKGLFDLLNEPVKQKQKSLSKDSINPSRVFDRDCVNFVHDLIYFSGPILHRDIVKILEAIFGDGDYKPVLKHLGLLVSFDTINRDPKSSMYFSNLSETFLDYRRVDTDLIISAFRSFIQKNKISKFYAIK